MDVRNGDSDHKSQFSNEMYKCQYCKALVENQDPSNCVDTIIDDDLSDHVCTIAELLVASVNYDRMRGGLTEKWREGTLPRPRLPPPRRRGSRGASYLR